MAKVLIEVVPGFGPTKGQVVSRIMVNPNYDSTLMAVLKTLQLKRKDAKSLTLYIVDFTGERVLPRGDLQEVLHDGAKIGVSKSDSADAAEASHQHASGGEQTAVHASPFAPGARSTQWPAEAHTVGNAGVMLVGKSAKHHGAPVALLGGRFYTGKKTYAYTDFGGGVERKKGETPQQGALREFVEELLGFTEEKATVTASKLCSATASNLVGGRPFIHKKNYVMFIVPADVVVETLQLSEGAEGESGIDLLFAEAKRNSELTSVALVSIQEMLRAAFSEGQFDAVSVRQLDGKERSSEGTVLRSCLVGHTGSICTIRDALEGFVCTCESEPPTALQPAEVGALALNGTASCVQDDRHPGTRRWNRARKADTCSEPIDANLQKRFACMNSTLDASASSSAPCVEEATSWTNPSLKAPAKAAAPSPCQQRTQCWKGSHTLSPYIFDMETGDPDDVLTLLFLASHPSVELRAVTITPGSGDQVALVRWLLQQLGLTDVRMGAQDWPSNASKPVNLSASFYKSFGRSKDGEPKCERADQVLFECCDASVTLVTGGPLHNLGGALKIDGFSLGRWVAQGGFAGEGVVPLEKQMDKFQGKTTCPTWNFGGNIKAAEAALASLAIERKICVSKNVCHSVVYDEEFHGALQQALAVKTREGPQGRRTTAFKMIYDAMDAYLQRKPGGKKLHDPLALATAFDESVCELAEVQLFCQKGQWGSRLLPGSNIWISISYDAFKFQNALLK